MSKNLITGGLGFVGYNLARELLKQGEEVIIFDVVQNSKLVEDIKGEAKIILGDVGNWNHVLDAIKNNDIDCIYHLGALLTDPAEENHLAAYMRVNANGTFHVLEAARLFDVASVVFTSSLAIFGPGIPPSVSDDAPQKPMTIYGVIKAFGEGLGEYYHRKFGVNFRGVRFPAVIGPGRHGAVGAYTSLIIEEPARGRPFIVAVDETAQIPLLYIKDAVLSLVSLEKASDASLTRRVYNLQGFSPTAKEMADTVRRHLPGAHIEFRPQEAAVRVVHSWPRELDDTNARQDWGWNPAYDLDKTVHDFIAEVQANQSERFGNSKAKSSG